MASTTVTRSPHAWMRIAFAMFAVGWGANQFSPMLIVYRHELRLTAGAVAGLFLVYAFFCLLCLYYTRSRYWYYGLAFAFLYILVLSFQNYYALATVRRNHWGTR